MLVILPGRSAEMYDLNRTGDVAARVTRTEVISVTVIKMQSELVGFDPVERATITRTEGMSVRVIRMLGQLVGLGSVERANVKSDVFC